MVLVFAIGDFFAFEKLLLSSEASQHGILALSLQLGFLNQLLYARGTRLLLLALASGKLLCKVLLELISFADSLCILSTISVKLLVELTRTLVVVVFSHISSVFFLVENIGCLF